MAITVPEQSLEAARPTAREVAIAPASQACSTACITCACVRTTRPSMSSWPPPARRPCAMHCSPACGGRAPRMRASPMRAIARSTRSPTTSSCSSTADARDSMRVGWPNSSRMRKPRTSGSWRRTATTTMAMRSPGGASRCDATCSCARADSIPPIATSIAHRPARPGTPHGAIGAGAPHRTLDHRAPARTSPATHRSRSSQRCVATPRCAYLNNGP